MIMADGNTQEYEALKGTTCETYLLKLENYVDKVVMMEKQLSEMKARR